MWDENRLRYWDGEEWTDAYAPRSPPLSGASKGNGADLGIALAAIIAGVFGLVVGFSLPSRSDVGLLGGYYINDNYLMACIAAGGVSLVLGILLAWAALDKPERDNGSLVAFAIVAACCAGGGGALLLAAQEDGQRELEQERSYENYE